MADPRHELPGPAAPPPASRLACAYRAVAVGALNAALLLLALNLLAALALAIFPEPPSGARRFTDEELARAYPGRDPAEVEALLAETWERGYVYEPFTQFREREFRGEHVTVTAEGYRANGGAPAPWPPPPEAIYLFGGSTAFGYGLSDRETLAAALERRLAGAGCGPRLVYNFARSNYFSSQERILFEQLLAAGRRPAAAVFVDGLNDALYPRDEPKFTARLRHLMDEPDGALWWRAATRLPLVRLVRRLAPEPPDDGYGGPPEPELAERILDRWARNRGLIEAVAAREGVVALFVWQPVPAYGYDLAHHPFAADGIPAAELLALVYGRMDERREGTDSAFLWLGDLQAGRTEPLYVDRVHYDAAFTDEIAGRIAGALAPRLCPPGAEQAGGDPR